MAEGQAPVQEHAAAIRPAMRQGIRHASDIGLVANAKKSRLPHISATRFYFWRLIFTTSRIKYGLCPRDSKYVLLITSARRPIRMHMQPSRKQMPENRAAASG